MSYILKDIFGDTPRVKILEELSERWGEKLTAAELARMTDTVEKTVYTHLHQLEEIGIVTSISGRPTKYGLNQNDQRALSIMLIEDEEYLRKIQISIAETSEIEENCGVFEHIEEGPSFWSLFKNNKNIHTPFDMKSIQLEGVSK